MSTGFSQNVVYDNEVLENKIADILETGLDAMTFMTVDRDLQQNAGMKKVIHTYNYKGAVEAVAEGQATTDKAKLTFAEKEYVVKVKQEEFEYTDEQFMKDPMILEAGLKGAATSMVNDLNNDFFTEIAKTTTLSTYSNAIKYDDIVDAIAKMNLEDETGLFVLINPKQKAEIRKDPDFKASRMGEIIHTGQIGDISGIPVAVSKKVPADTVFVATKEAVTCFVKKEVEVEQDRIKNKRINSIIPRKVGLVALTDSTKAVKITKEALTDSTKAVKITKEA